MSQDISLRVEEGGVVVSPDGRHIKYNRLHCMIELPFAVRQEGKTFPTYYLAFPVGGEKTDLMAEGMSFDCTLYSEGWRSERFCYTFESPLLGYTEGIRLSARNPSAAQTSIDVCLNNIVNYLEGDAKLCVFQLCGGGRYQLAAFCTIRKLLRDLSIESFVSDRALIESGEHVTFSWELYGERAYRLLPFDRAMSAEIPASRTVKLEESTDVVLEVSSFLDTDGAPGGSPEPSPETESPGASDSLRDTASLRSAVGGEDRAVLQKGLRIAVWDSEIVSFGLSLFGSDRPREKLTVPQGGKAILSWEVSHLGARRLTISPAAPSGTLPAKGSMTLYPQEDTVYTLQISGKDQPQTAAFLYVDEVKIRSFTAEPQSLLYGEKICFKWDLKQAQSASIAPEVGALVIEDGRKEFTARATREYQLTATGKLSDGREMTVKSAVLPVTVRDPLAIRDFRVETAFFDGDNYIKVFHWSIDYPGDELKISVLVDDQPVLRYEDGASHKTSTEYINCRFHQRAVLVCEGRGGQTDTKEIRR